MKTNTENISFKYLWLCFAFLIFLSGITTKPLEGKSTQRKVESYCTNISLDKQLCNLLSKSNHDSNSNPIESSDESSVELEEEVDDCQYFRFFRVNSPPNCFSLNCITDFKNRSALVFHPEKDSPPPQV